MLKIAIIIGSTRPGRKAEAVHAGSTTSQRNGAMHRLKLWTSQTSICLFLMNRSLP